MWSFITTPTFCPHPETPQDSSQDKSRTSLVVQWERICLPMQGTGVWSLVWEDSTCRGTLNSCAPTEPAHLELGSRNCWSPHMPGACAPRKKPLQRSPLLTTTREKPEHSSEDPVQPQIKIIKKKKRQEWKELYRGRQEGSVDTQGVAPLRNLAAVSRDSLVLIGGIPLLGILQKHEKHTSTKGHILGHAHEHSQQTYSQWPKLGIIWICFCHNKIPDWRAHKQWTFIFSQFWRLGVWDQNVLWVLSPWLVDGCLLPVSSHGPYKDTRPVGLGPTLMTSFYLSLKHFFKILSSNIFTFWGTRGYSTYEFCGRHNAGHNRIQNSISRGMDKLFHLYNGVPCSNKGKQMTDSDTDARLRHKWRDTIGFHWCEIL